jgi:hypothetical protein
MAKVVTMKDFETLKEEESKSDYFILKADNGQVVIEFKSPLYSIQEGDEDLFGRVWNQDWTKHEALAIVEEREVSYSFGGQKSPNYWAFRNKCMELGIKPDELSGTVWSVLNHPDASYQEQYEYKFIGRKDIKEEKKKPAKKEEASDEDLDNVIKVITKFKKDNPDVANDLKMDGLVTVISMHAHMSKTKAESYIEKLQAKGIISIKDDKIKFE